MLFFLVDIVILSGEFLLLLVNWIEVFKKFNIVLLVDLSDVC